MQVWIFSLISVIVVSLVSLIGVVFLSLRQEKIRQSALVLISFAVGALLGDVFIHLVPKMAKSEVPFKQSSALILAGILLFFLLEKFLRHNHEIFHPHHPGEEISKPELAAINITGDALHNFIDGALIAASYSINPVLGLSTTVAVMVHEIPQELGDFGVLIHSGFKAKKALLFNLLSASTAILGAIVTLLIGKIAGNFVSTLMIPVTAGGFVYIAIANLIPELQHDRSLRGSILQTACVLSGIGCMALLTLLD